MAIKNYKTDKQNGLSLGTGHVREIFRGMGMGGGFYSCLSG